MPETPEFSSDSDSPLLGDHRLQVVQGYYELGMIDDAWEELRAISQSGGSLATDLLQMEVLLLIKDGKIEEAFLRTGQLRELEPDLAAGFIHGAYCLHEMGRTQEALCLLQSAPESAEAEAVYHYNLACYQAILGDPESARCALRESFDLDRRLIHQARKDPDLAALRDSM